MRHALFHTHLHHEDLERALLILYLLVFVTVVAVCAWQLLTVQPHWPDLFKPETMQFWPY